MSCEVAGWRWVMCVRACACMSLFATGSAWPSDEKSTLSRFEVRTCEARWRKRG